MQEKRFVTLRRYQEISGLSYATVDHLCKTGQLNYITTEGGLRRIDTQQDTDTAAIAKRLDVQERMLKALCGHLGVTK